MPNGKGWHLVRPDDRKSSLFDTKEEAITKAKQELTEDKGELFIFDNAGPLISHQ